MLTSVKFCFWSRNAKICSRLPRINLHSDSRARGFEVISKLCFPSQALYGIKSVHLQHGLFILIMLSLTLSQNKIINGQYWLRHNASKHISLPKTSQFQSLCHLPASGTFRRHYVSRNKGMSVLPIWLQILVQPYLVAKKGCMLFFQRMT